MQIKQLADAAGLTVSRRPDEKAGLLRRLLRGDNNYCCYADTDLQRLRFIR